MTIPTSLLSGCGRWNQSAVAGPPLCLDRMHPAPTASSSCCASARDPRRFIGFGSRCRIGPAGGGLGRGRRRGRGFGRDRRHLRVRTASVVAVHQQQDRHETDDEKGRRGEGEGHQASTRGSSRWLDGRGGRRLGVRLGDGRWRRCAEVDRCHNHRRRRGECRDRYRPRDRLARTC